MSASAASSASASACSNLPAVVGAYFDAANGHDGAAVAACFSADGAVTDEGATHRGRAAIKAWNEAASARYAVRMTPSAIAVSADTCQVTARVSGSFPGSPVDLAFAFTLAGAAIATLVITP